MTSANIETTNLEFNGVKLRIFDKIGFNSGKNWVINALEGCFVEVDPAPISQDIIGILNTDADEGNFDMIDHISLKPYQLLSLYLEGALQIGSIISAEDHDEWVTFKNVQFKTKNGTANFVIRVSDDYEMATIDANGYIV